MDDLPLDPDPDPERNRGPTGRGSPPHLSPPLLGAVWLGGAAGTGSRYLIGRVVPHAAGVPIATLAVNVVGAFALGVLMEALVRRGSDTGRRRALRLLLGTGFLGGFTTYSALAVDTVTLVRGGLLGTAVGYAAATVLVGGLASLAGIAVGTLTRRPA